MGRMKLTLAQRVRASRRLFFRRAGTAALAFGAASLLPACGGGNDDEPAPAPAPAPAPPAGTGTFEHGVASGDPLADRVILWTRVTPTTPGPVAVNYVVATDTSLANVVAQASITTDAALDYTVKVHVGSLQPSTTYYYRFVTSQGRSPIGRTRTLPAAQATHLRMAVVSCSSLAHGYFNAYRRIAERADLDLVVHLGDYIYEYASGEFGDLRAYEPAGEAVTLADYRARHAQYKREADLQEMHRQHPMIAIWDDHEVANNAYIDGAQNHSEMTEGAWPARVAAALQAYYEWMPVRVVDAGNLRKANRSFAFGDLVDLLMLEERLVARSAPLRDNATASGVFEQTGPFADPSRQMLGAEQEDWLATSLRASRAKWKVIGQGVMFAQLKAWPEDNADGGGRFLNADQWDGYQPARDRVYAVLEGNASTPPVGNVVVLSGDMHSSWAADLTRDPNNSDVASGGYDADSGAGSRAVEFVCTSVTSPSIIDTGGLAESALRLVNPHFKYIDLTRRGYLLLDADATRVIGEWWYVDTVESPSSGQSFGIAFQVQDGANRLTTAALTSPRAEPPPLAP